MRLRIIQELYLSVEPEWYDFLPRDSGPLEEQIAKYEKREIEEGITSLDKLEKGTTTVEVVKEETKSSE